MNRRSALAGLVVATGLIVTACSSGDTAPTTQPTPTTAPSTTAADTTTRATGPTSTLAYVDLDVRLDDDGARIALMEMYGWLADRSRPAPSLPQGLIEHLGDATVADSQTIEATLHAADLGDRGRVGVVTADDDVVLLADEGAGWEIVGAWLPRFDLDPWFGEPVRHVLVMGTDARPGQDQQNFRADSLHILSSNVAAAGGGILGIPRDTFVQASYGPDKFTNVNVYGGQEEMVSLAAEMSGLPIEGYLVTGFLNFQLLVNDFGGVVVDVPFAMADEKADAYISRGLQRLWGDKALGFSRNRNLPGADFTRSFHQGLVIAAALEGVLERDLTTLPDLVMLLDEYTWTNLTPGDLLTLAAGAFLIDPANVGNAVLPGQITTRAGASVVVLTDGAEPMFRDLDDGILTPDE